MSTAEAASIPRVTAVQFVASLLIAAGRRCCCMKTLRGVGALIQRGGRAVAGMLTIATAGGS